MKVAIISCVWGRIPLTRIWWQCLARVQAELSTLGIEATALVGGSESAHQSLCSTYGATWVEAENDKLGDKWNAVYTAALAQAPDYVCILGSDDFLSSGAVKQLADTMKAGTLYAGFQSVYMVEPSTGRGMLLDTQKRLKEVSLAEANGRPTIIDLDAHLPGQGVVIPKALHPSKHSLTMGAGRLVHRSLCGPNPWDAERSKGLDASFESALNLPPPFVLHSSLDAFVVDVKTSRNIWNFDALDASFPDCLLSAQETLAVLAALPEGDQLAALQ